ERAQQMTQSTFTVFDYEFMMLFVIGFASILLHLQAKALASNISGANDGAGPAAATVAAGKAVMGGGLYAASRGLFGAGGAGAAVCHWRRRDAKRAWRLQRSADQSAW